MTQILVCLVFYSLACMGGSPGLLYTHFFKVVLKCARLLSQLLPNGIPSLSLLCSCRRQSSPMLIGRVLLSLQQRRISQSMRYDDSLIHSLFQPLLEL